MRYSRVAFRYAEALFKEAQQAGTLSVVLQDILHVRACILASAELRNFLRSPIIKVEQKSSALKGLFSSAVSPVTLHFLLLLAEKLRTAETEGITHAFESLYNESQGIITVQVYSAVELEDRQKQDLVKKVQNFTGKQQVVAEYRLDPSLIGGFTVRVEDTVHDYSLKNKLHILKKHLAEGTLNN